MADDSRLRDRAVDDAARYRRRDGITDRMELAARHALERREHYERTGEWPAESGPLADHIARQRTQPKGP